MNSRERVVRTLQFDNPDRVPRQMWLLPWAEHHYPKMVATIGRDFPDDIVGAPEAYAKEPVTTGDMYAVGEYTDEWGCTFMNRQAGIIGEVKEPILTDWSDVDTIKPPEELLSVDIDAVNAFCASTDAFVNIPAFPRPFERLQFIRGTENIMFDLMDRPDAFMHLIDIIHDFYVKQLEVWAKSDVDALFFMDDWGSQQSLLINPATWREIFKPLYRDYIDIAKSNGKFIFMHSDGYIMDIIPDLIELGLDAVNSQIFCMGAEKLGEKFAGQITFWGEIDRQHLLPNGTTDDIADAVESVRASLWRNGGAIAQCEFGPGAKPENVYQVFKSWTPE